MKSLYFIGKSIGILSKKKYRDKSIGERIGILLKNKSIYRDFVPRSGLTRAVMEPWWVVAFFALVHTSVDAVGFTTPGALEVRRCRLTSG